MKPLITIISIITLGVGVGLLGAVGSALDEDARQQQQDQWESFLLE